MLLVAACGGGGDSPQQPQLRPSQAENRPPVADAGEDRIVQAGETITLSGAGSNDPDGGLLDYSWTQRSGAQVALHDTDTAQAVFEAPTMTTEAVLSFGLTVTDADGLSSNDAVSVTVHPPVVVHEDVGIEAVRITSRAPAEDTYARAEMIAVEVTFSQPVTVVGEPTLALVIGSEIRQAVYIGSSDGRTLAFRYTVHSTDRDGNGISIEANALSANGGSITSGDEPALLDIGDHAIANAPNHRVAGHDSRAAVITGVRVASQPVQDGTYAEGEVVAVEVSFSQAITVTGIPSLALMLESGDEQAAYEAGSGTETLTFLHVVEDNDHDENGISIPPGALALVQGTIMNSIGGNEVELDLAGHAVNDLSNHKVQGDMDRTPVVIHTRIASGPQARNAYGRTETIRVEVVFSQMVEVRGEPTLSLVIGSQTRQAVYVGGSGSRTLSFRYRVQVDDLDDDGIDIPAGALSLANGSITGLTNGRAAALDLRTRTIAQTPKQTPRHQVDGRRDHRARAIRMDIVSDPKSHKTYGVGEQISVRVVFSENITVDDAAVDGPSLAFSIGARSNVQRFSGKGDRWLRFDYMVAESDSDPNGISIAANALQLGDGAILDAGGQLANIDLGHLVIRDDGNHRVDGGGSGPIADAGSDLRAFVGDEVVLDGSGSHHAANGGGPLTYTWEKMCGPDIVLNNNDTANPTFTAAAKQISLKRGTRVTPPLPNEHVEPFAAHTTATFRLTVTDEQGRQDSDQVTVTVAPETARGGTFEPSSNFKGICATSKRPDLIEAERAWLRSWSHETYLWYDEIVDHSPADAEHSAEVYFELMQTYAEAPSCGRPKDAFHFSVPTPVSSGASASSDEDSGAGYGATWLVLRSIPPRKVVVGYVQPGSPAEQAGLRRGDELIETDGVDVRCGNGIANVNVINHALYDTTGGITHDFRLLRGGAITANNIGACPSEDPDPGDVVHATMSTGALAIDPVPFHSVIDTDTGKVGYLFFTSHNQTAEAELVSAIDDFVAAGIDDLVLDIRYNEGGLLTIAKELASMIPPRSRTRGKVYERLQYNDKLEKAGLTSSGRLNHPEYGHFVSVRHLSEPGTPLPSLNLSRVFILTTGITCSASESIINGLLGIDFEVIQIGNATCGKPYGSRPTQNCGNTYYTIQFIGVNAKGFGDYQHGFAPEYGRDEDAKSIPVAGCTVYEDFGAEIGSQSEAMLAAALGYRATSVCPDERTTGLPPSRIIDPNPSTGTTGRSVPPSRGKIVR